jgi:sulfur carrier protein ThiS
MIIVSGMGKGRKKVPFTEGMSVGEAINKSELKPSENATITLNGKATTKDIKIKDGDRITVTPKVSNG